jgi:hypothetical protein
MDLAGLRKQLVSCFNTSELNNLCFDLGVNFESLQGVTIDDKARELIQYCQRNSILINLVEHCQELRPKLDWTIEPKLIEQGSAVNEKADFQNQPDSEKNIQLKLTVHRAFFKHNGLDCCFINATNLSHVEIVITHVWFDCGGQQIHALQSSRPLPKRLQPNETWETWIEVNRLPVWVYRNPYGLARARLSNGTIVESQENKNVPEEGFVPGGPI